MAKHEQDREDLMREATALVKRVELKLPGYSETWIVGFRSSGEASVFVGADPVLQFNRQNELRRGFFDGKLLKAECGRLVELDRRRTESEVRLVRRELDDSETNEFLRLAERILQHFRQTLNEGATTPVAKVPETLDAVKVLTNWLDVLPEHLVVANVPNVQTR